MSLDGPTQVDQLPSGASATGGADTHHNHPQVRLHPVWPPLAKEGPYRDAIVQEAAREENALDPSGFSSHIHLAGMDGGEKSKTQRNQMSCWLKCPLDVKCLYHLQAPPTTPFRGPGRLLRRPKRRTNSQLSQCLLHLKLGGSSET